MAEKLDSRITRVASDFPRVHGKKGQAEQLRLSAVSISFSEFESTTRIVTTRSHDLVKWLRTSK